MLDSFQSFRGNVLIKSTAALVASVMGMTTLATDLSMDTGHVLTSIGMAFGGLGFLAHMIYKFSGERTTVQMTLAQQDRVLADQNRALAEIKGMGVAVKDSLTIEQKKILEQKDAAHRETNERLERLEEMLSKRAEILEKICGTHAEMRERLDKIEERLGGAGEK